MKNELKFTGVVVKKYPVEEFAAKNDPTKIYRNQSIVIEEEDEQYPNSITIGAFGDNISKFDGVNEGDRVEAIYNCRSKEWVDNSGKAKSQCSNSIWKVNVTATASPFVSAAQPAPIAANPFEAVNTTQAPVSAPGTAEREDDLPF